MLRDSPAEDDGVTGSAANLIPEPEPEKKLQNQEDQKTKTMMNHKRGMLHLQK